jgi:hypothetical protein
MTPLSTLAFAFALAIPVTTPSEDSVADSLRHSDAKSLYYNNVTSEGARTPESAKKPQQSPTGLKYWVFLVDQDDPRGEKVDTRRIFTTGEKIQLHIESNIDGYLAVVAFGTDGSASLLFPSASHDLHDNFVRANQATVIPSPRNYFEFNGDPGTEKLFLILAPTKAEMEGLRLAPRMERERAEVLVASYKREKGAKNLVVGGFSSAEPANFAVNPSGKTVLQEVLLFHGPAD